MPRQDLLDLIDTFTGGKVLVVGDVMLDEYLWGDVRRICPEAPVPVVVTGRRTVRPGGAANAAANLAALGAGVKLCGAVGQDAAAESLRNALREIKVETHGLLTAADRPTTVKMRIMAHNQQVLRVDTEQNAALRPELAASLADHAEGLLGEVGALLLCDYGKGVLCPPVVGRLIDAARRVNVPVVVDPKGGDYAKYRGASLIKPNIGELEAVHRRPLQSEVELRSAGEDLAAQLDGAAVLLTRGPDGMTLFRVGEEPWQQGAAVHRPVYDVTGAGDTVVSIIALAFACAAPVTQAMFLANVAAGVVVGKLGTSVVTPDELREALWSVTQTI